MVILSQGRIEDRHQFIAPESGQRAALVPNLLDHDIKIIIEQVDHLAGCHALAHACKTANIGGDDGYFLDFSAQVQCAWIFNQTLYDIRMHEATEDAPHFLNSSLGALQLGAIIDDQRHTNMVPIRIAQGRDVDAQIDQATTRNFAIDVIGYNRAMIVLD